MPGGAPADPAADRIRAAIAAEVAAVLGVPFDTLDPARSLDEYGLDSVDALMAAGALARRLGLDLPPELLIQHRSFDDIAAAVIRIARPGGDRTAAALFLFPGWGGRDPRLARLADRCRDRVASRIVSIGSWNDWVRHRLALPDLVRQAADGIEAARPDGELRLGGYSQGATMAFATARELQRRGRVVGWLGLFDAVMDPMLPPPAEQRRHARRQRPVAAGLRWARALPRRDREPGQLRVHLATRLFTALPRPVGGLLLHGLARTPLLLRGRGGRRVDNLLQMHVFSVLWAAWAPDATPMPDGFCRVVLFRSADAGPGDLGWTRYCPSLQVVPVPGDHRTMFDPEHLDTLAAALVVAAGPDQPTYLSV